MRPTVIDVIRALLARRAGHVTDGPERAVSIDAWLTRFAVTARRLGRAPLAPDADETVALAEAGVTWPLDAWRVDDLGRAALLLTAAAHVTPEAFVELCERCYREGDLGERVAVLRALPLLPEPERFLVLGLDACRSSIEPVFEAIACENPYPARAFPDLNFNQMVLKAVFVGVPVTRIVGLAARATADLARMAADYASERQAAGRPVPPDLAHLQDLARSAA